MPSTPHLRKAIIRVSGMTCRSCETIIERSLRKLPGVRDVSANTRSGTVTITADMQKLPSEASIASALRNAGYALDDGTAPAVDGRFRASLEIGAALIIVLAVGKVLGVLDIVSLAPSTSGALTLGGVLLIGLVAGTSSCLAVTGGLLLSMAARHLERHHSETPWQKFQPLLQFNVGRLAGYTLLGGIIGLIGQAITLNTIVTGYLNVGIAVVMLYLALTILDVVPKGSCPIRPPKWMAHRIAALGDRHSAAGPFTLGALTFFLPCGFTQSLQLVALASGSFTAGAAIMGVFALGTLPSLIGLSAASSFTRGSGSRVFLRLSGAAVLVLGVMNFQSGLALTGIDIARAFRGTSVMALPPAVAQVQEISMRVLSDRYEPSELSIRAGVPVRWTIDGSQARGCTSVLVIPSLNISQPLRDGKNIVEFTAPAEPGPLAFSCSMGMVHGTINVL